MAGEGKLTHVDEQGRVTMVDVGTKDTTQRTAVAHGSLTVGPDTLRRIADGDTPKGDVLATARVAGIMAAKRTPELIPLCHQIALSSVKIELTLAWPEQRIEIVATCKAVDRTGVEME
ncbi:MAG: cyclic pyranopterin monophosphate synthase MoaC, partial [Myxococcales bacterium]|nr:cyclic pyranopterin monophosphate synthase MoaC [Myxococcales bacterium]